MLTLQSNCSLPTDSQLEPFSLCLIPTLASWGLFCHWNLLSLSNSTMALFSNGDYFPIPKILSHKFFSQTHSLGLLWPRRLRSRTPFRRPMIKLWSLSRKGRQMEQRRDWCWLVDSLSWFSSCCSCSAFSQSWSRSLENETCFLLDFE